MDVMIKFNGPTEMEMLHPEEDEGDAPQRYTGDRELIAAQDHRLHLARYYVHKMRVKQYHDAMQRGMPVEEARQRYAHAMKNYDELMRGGGGGQFTDADQQDMDKGFPY